MEVKKATQRTDIPVVFAVANIEETGLIDNIREPGGNMTGVRYPGPDLAVKRFEVMRELAPKAKRYWIPYQKGYPIIKSQMDALKPVAAAAGVALFEAPAADAAELETLLQAQLKAGGVDAILFFAVPLAVTPDAFMVMGKFAAEHKIPIGGALMEVEGYETIFGVNIDSFKTGAQAAVIADKILRGAKAGAIPVVSSENYFEISYRTAQKFEVNVSESLLNQANKIIR
jgi:putative ABC transport system substrate-binding protein